MTAALIALTVWAVVGPALGFLLACQRQHVLRRRRKLANRLVRDGRTWALDHRETETSGDWMTLNRLDPELHRSRT